MGARSTAFRPTNGPRKHLNRLCPHDSARAYRQGAIARGPGAPGRSAPDLRGSDRAGPAEAHHRGRTRSGSRARHSPVRSHPGRGEASSAGRLGWRQLGPVGTVLPHPHHLRVIAVSRLPWLGRGFSRGDSPRDGFRRWRYPIFSHLLRPQGDPSRRDEIFQEKRLPPPRSVSARPIATVRPRVEKGGVNRKKSDWRERHSGPRRGERQRLRRRRRAAHDFPPHGPTIRTAR